MVQQDVALLQHFEKVLRAMFREVEWTYRVWKLRPLALKLFMVNNLLETGKVNEAVTRNNKNIMLIQIPLYLQQPHHPGVGVLLHFHSNHASGAACFQLK